MGIRRLTTSNLDTTSSDFKDPIIHVNSNASGENTTDIGFLLDRGSSGNIGIIWDESANEVVLIETSANASAEGNITISKYANLSVDKLSIANSTIQFPTSDGTDGQVLATDGNGNLSFASVSGGSGADLTGNIDLGTDNTNTITFNGLVDSDIIPSANVTYNLGNATNRWQDLFLAGNTIDLGGAKIQTDTDSGAVAILPKPTANVANPKGIVFAGDGTVKPVETTAGVVSQANFTAAASSSATLAAVALYTNSSSFPSTGNENGAMAFDQSTNQLSVWDGTEWVIVQAVNVASIGKSDSITAEVIDGYEYYVYTGTGTFTVTQAGTFDVLMVGGGGATYEGGAVPPGAAGGGEVKYGEAILPVGSHTVVIGAGGTGQAVQSVNFAGGDTTITVGGVTVTAKGGGGGGYYEDGFDGGSGGAGGYGGTSSGAVLASNTSAGLWAVMSGHGNLAGSAGGITQGAAGGGGAGTAGKDGGFTGNLGDGGDGGDGLYLADYQYWGENGYYGGGGGGACEYTPVAEDIGGLGGKGGGGSGQNGDDTYRNGPFGESRTDCNGLPNTGGGSGSYEDDTQQINGGSGIVIFRTVA